MTPIAPHLTTFLREYLPVRGHVVPTRVTRMPIRSNCCSASPPSDYGTSPSALALEQLDAALVLAFLEHIENVRGNSARTRNARLAAVKAFAHFIEYRVPSALEQVRCILAIPFKKTDEALVDFLNQEELQALLDAPDPKTRSGTRDRAMLHVCFVAGLRVSELVGLRLDDLQTHPQASLRVRGKGRRERVLPLWKETAKVLRAWTAIRESTTAFELFLNARGGPMTRSGFEYILRKHVKTAAIACPSIASKRVSPHVLRHTCAMHTLQATHDVRKVSLWLGHASVKSTEIYLRADPTEKLDALEAGIAPSLRRGRFKAPDRLLAMLRSS